MEPLLIVEDEACVGNTMAAWLADAGYFIVQARSAEEALDTIGCRPPAVAVCDIGLPGRDGIWLIDQLRRRYPDTGFVLTTGSDNRSHDRLPRGIACYLQKPFGRTQLREAVARAADRQIGLALNRSEQFGLEKEAQQCRRRVWDAIGMVPITTRVAAWEAFDRAFTSPEERDHSARVVAFALEVAERMKTGAPERHDIEWAARFHDIGLLTVPCSIRSKPAPLSREEWAILGRAPSQAFEILFGHPYLSGAGYLLRSTRERPDGLGYPDGLRQEDTPLGSRIVAVAEALDVIAHDQPHRKGRSPADAALELIRCAGTQFDPDVVDSMLEVLAGAGQDQSGRLERR